MFKKQIKCAILFKKCVCVVCACVCVCVCVCACVCVTTGECRSSMNYLPIMKLLLKT